MAKSLLSVKSTKKKPAPRQPKYTDEKFTGGELTFANWDKLSDEQQRVALLRSYNFYNYYHTPAEMRKYVVQYAQRDLSWGKAEIAAFAECEDQRVGMTVCSFSKMKLNGYPDAVPDYVTSKLTELLAYGTAKLRERQAREGNITPKRTVQDHMRDKQYDIMGDIEHYYDEFLAGAELPDFVAYFRDVKMPQQFVSRIQAYYQEQLAEVLEAKSKDADADLKAAYKWIGKPEAKRLQEFHTKLADALSTYGQVKAAVRKARVKKPVSKEKLIKNIRYCAEDTTLNLVSINPVDIIGATVLWVYNKKTRKLGKYTAAADSGTLGIKGSTILGYDATASVAKTVRKPEVVMKKFMAAGKVALRSYLEDIKATPVQLTGRLNADTMLLKIQR
jgi:hypothetical protein